MTSSTDTGAHHNNETKMNNFAIALILGVFLTATLCSMPAFSQQFPSKPIRILVGFGPGAGVDSFARLYADKLQKELGTPVIVENKPGALQIMAINQLLSSPADGYTLFMGASSSLVTGPAIRKDLPYTPEKDFQPIAMLAKSQGVLTVNANFPADNLEELISYAKNNPGKINFGSAGVGSSNHLLMEYLKNATGTDMVHIPFNSDPDVIAATGSGTVD